MNSLIHLELDSKFVEVDPTGRYARFNDILGKGASKTVYRAFDEYEGIEVAWNQVKFYNCVLSPEEIDRLYCEIHLLKTLKHPNIMKFYTSWVDNANRNINFITELFTSGTLRQYRLKHKRVNTRALKHWCRQILKGLLYLHSHNPPVIHRDLKCDNIFVNGNQGEVKLGDLGLATILTKSHAVDCVGTPEFMAPEIYAEQYNELADIYSFGMCILEMVTLEYPYSECTHTAQIYNKVISGKKPNALTKVEHPEIRRIIEKCLATASQRLSARELLEDPFLYIEDCDLDIEPVDYRRELDYVTPLHTNSILDLDYGRDSISNTPVNDQNEWECYNHKTEQSGKDAIFHNHDEEHDEENDEESSYHGISIKGNKRADGRIFFRLSILDNEGCIKNIYFPFHIEYDTAISVATEMVNEVDIIDEDVTMIADMINGEIAALVPEWKLGQGIEENPFYCHNCESNHTSKGSIINLLSVNHTGLENLQILQCLENGCAATHGRIEEITYQALDPLPNTYKIENCCDSLSHETSFWNQPGSSILGSIKSQSSIHQENMNEQVLSTDQEKETASVITEHQILMGELKDQGNGAQNSLCFRTRLYQKFKKKLPFLNIHKGSK